MKNKITVFFALLCIASSPAYAAIIIDNTTFGLYNSGIGDIEAIDGPGGFLPGPNVSEGDPTIVLGSDPSLAFTAAFGADWLAGDYSGGTWSAVPVAIPSGWTINTETAIVYDFTLSSASDIHIDLGVDNGIIAWLDGAFLFGATRPGGSSITEYDIDLLSVASGNHSLQILRADHGGGQDYDISVDATDSVSVPEPALLSLFGIGLLGLGIFRRKRKS